MTTQVFNQFKFLSAGANLDLDADDVRLALLMNNTTLDTENGTETTITDFTLLDEMDGANYSTPGYTFTSTTLTNDTANTRTEFDAEDALFSALGNGARPVQGALVLKFITAIASSIAICFLDFTADQSPGGSDFTVSFDAEGILQLA